MEVLSITDADQTRESLADLVDEYKTLKDDYTLQGARKQMLDNLLLGKVASQPVENSNTTIRLDAFLVKARELSSNIAFLNAPDEMIEENRDLDLEEHIELELSRGQELLQKMLDEQAVIKASIISSRQQIVDLNNADLLSAKENTAPSNVRNSVEIILDNAELRDIQKSQITSSNLYIGLSTLTGVKSLEVTEAEITGGVKILIAVGECSFALTLDTDKRVCDIKLLTGKISIDLKKLLQDSRVLPCPQDLRYAVFAVGASQNAAESVKIALPELRKSCIVKVLSPLQFELGLPNSITAIVSIHECYPEVPGGVHIQSLSGIDGTPEETLFLENIKSSTNSHCFRTISAMFNYLTSPKLLGSHL